MESTQHGQQGCHLQHGQQEQLQTRATWTTSTLMWARTNPKTRTRWTTGQPGQQGQLRKHRQIEQQGLQGSRENMEHKEQQEWQWHKGQQRQKNQKRQYGHEG